MSIRDFDTLKTTVQVALNTGKTYFPKYKESKFKDALREFKFGYYFYRQFVLKKNQDAEKDVSGKSVDYTLISRFCDYLKANYDLQNVVFVFRPDVDNKFPELCKQHGLRVLELYSDDDYKSWSFENDHHWSCVGHEKASKQVSKFLKEYVF